MTRQATVLYDAPGPKTQARNRLYSILGAVLLLGLLAWVAMRFADNGQFDSIRWSWVEYTTVQELVWEGLKGTLTAFALAVVFSLLLGALLATARLSDHRVVRWAATAFVTFFRAMPLLVMIFFLYQAPAKLDSWPMWLDWLRDPLWALVMGLTLYNGTVQAEAMRAGILALPKGQSEAAYALGMRKTQVMVSILVPQGIRTMLPSIISQMVVTLKDTSLGFVITYTELMHFAQQIGGYQDFQYPFIQVSIIFGAIYVLLCLALSALASWLERYLASDRATWRRTTGTVAADPAPDGAAA